MNLLRIQTAIFSLLVMMVISLSASAQQDEQSSLYMFNPLQYNPAYAGSRGDLNATAVVRSQWVGINGAPKSQFVSFNTPLSFRNMAVGMHLSNDIVGAKTRTSFYGDYAYTLNFEKGRRLNFGISGGGEQISLDYAKLIADDPTETDVLASITQFKFNSGIGAYYYTERFFAGFSIPRMFETGLKSNSVVLSNTYTKRHYFLTAGYVFPINSVIDLKTSVLVKAIANAPITADLNANLFFYKKVWAGLMYRFNESIGANVAYQIKESLMFGYSFDYPINGLNRVNNAGSHEIMLNYSMNNRKKAFGSPRYF
jgi:type IX secretion system PorP/SprF family membrane protein